MSRYNPHHPNAEAVFEAAKFWRQNCLEADRSVFMKDKKLWTSDLLEQLNQALNPAGGSHYIDILENQLDSTSAACKQLAAEHLWLLYLYETRSSWTPELKRKQIQRIWSGVENEEFDKAHQYLGDDVLGGVGTGAQGLKTNFLKELVLLNEIVRSIKGIDSAQRSAIIEDPWQFARWVDSLVNDQNRIIPNILTHLLYPDDFERISSGAEKKQMLGCWGNLSTTTIKRRLNSGEWDRVTIDEELLDLRQTFERTHKSVDFYDGDFNPENRFFSDSRILDRFWEPQRAKAINSSVLGRIADRLVHVRNLACLDSGEIEKFGDNYISEHEGLTHLVVPFLHALGWTDEQIAVQWENVDLCLFPNGVRKRHGCRYLIEVKKRSHDFRKSLWKAFVQAKDYALEKFSSPCSIVITNGVCYQVYEYDLNAYGQYLPCVYANLKEFNLNSLDAPMDDLKGQDRAVMALIRWMMPPA